MSPQEKLSLVNGALRGLDEQEYSITKILLEALKKGMSSELVATEVSSGRTFTKTAIPTAKLWYIEHSEGEYHQTTLGELVEWASSFNPTVRLPCLLNPHSYRGYYSDLAFEADFTKTKSATELYNLLEGCLGTTFEGYKGGEYTMTKDTLVWIANYGCEGHRLVDMYSSYLTVKIETK